jgi:hypothetical protein
MGFPDIAEKEMSEQKRVCWQACWALALAFVATAASWPLVAAEDKATRRMEQAASPKDKPGPQKFVRVLRDQQERPAVFQTAIVRYERTEGGRDRLGVDLIAVVHIADKAYYEELNKRFAEYEAVLYELVAPRNAPPPQPKEPSGSLLSAVQRGLKNVLALEFQLDVIDYTAKNLVHADMSPAELQQAMRDRGESIWSLVLRMMGYAMARQQPKNAQTSDLDILFALFSKDRAKMLKQFMAEELEDMEGSLMAIEGPQGSALISGRNAAALKVLREQVAKGKRRLAIFYGAAHMPDFDKQLREQFSLQPVNTEWLDAWNMRPATAKK